MPDDLKMPQLNSIQVSGRLTRDPELKYIQSGKAVCNFGVAVGDGFGENSKTYFFNVTQWGDAAERTAEGIKKGYPVIIDGKMTRREFDDNEGNKRTAYDITAFRVQCLRWANNGDQRGDARSGGVDQSKNDQGIEEPIPEDDIPF